MLSSAVWRSNSLVLRSATSSASSSTAATAPATSPPKPSTSTAEIGGRQLRVFGGGASTISPSPSLHNDLDVLAGRQPVGRGEAVEDAETLLAKIGERHPRRQLGDAVARAHGDHADRLRMQPRGLGRAQATEAVGGLPQVALDRGGLLGLGQEDEAGDGAGVEADRHQPDV